jgi:hypothetical protein
VQVRRFCRVRKTSTGMRLSPLLIADHARDWKTIHDLATKHRRGVGIAALVTGSVIALIAGLILSGNSGSTPIFIVLGLVAITMTWQSTALTHLEQLRRLQTPDIYVAICNKLGGRQNYLAAQSQPPRYLIPGDLACPLDEWKQVEDREEDKQISDSLLRFVVASERTDDNRVRIGLANATGSTAAARSEDGIYQMRRLNSDPLPRTQKTPHRLAAAIVDLIEVLPTERISSLNQTNRIKDKISDYLDRWPHLEALSALLAARAAKLCDASLGTDLATTTALSGSQVIQAAERLLYPEPGRAKLRSSEVFFFPLAFLPSQEVVAKLLHAFYLTDLGCLWRDAGRTARHEPAQRAVVEWLIETSATRKQPGKLQEFPTERRASGEHFFSYTDLTSAIRSLTRDGYIEQSAKPGPLIVSPTAKGIAWEKEGLSMQDRSQSHPEVTHRTTTYTTNIRNMNGGTVGIGEHVNQGAALSQREMGEVTAMVESVRGLLPYIPLDASVKQEVGKQLECIDQDIARRADKGRIATSLKAIRDVLKIVGETTITAAVNEFLEKLGFPGVGH